MRPIGGGLLLLLSLAPALAAPETLPRVTALPAPPAAHGGATISAAPWFPSLPELNLLALDGSPLPVRPSPGKVLLLDFWASWCAPCREELPLLQRLWERQRPHGLEAWAVNVREGAEIAGRIARELGLQVPVALDPGVADEKLGVRSLPTVLLVDGEGRIRRRWDGYRTGIDREIEDEVRALLGGNAAPRTRALGTVESGPAVRGRWVREFPGELGGVAVDGDRVLVRRAGRLTLLDADGAAVAEGRAPASSGRLVRGGGRLLGWRPGSSEIVTFDPADGSHRVVGLPSPVVALHASEHGILVGGPDGAWTVDLASFQATPLGDRRGVRAVAWAGPWRGVLAGEDLVRWFGPDGSEAGTSPVPRGTRALVPLDATRVLASPDDLAGWTRGRVVAEAGEIVVATERGRLLVLDPPGERVLLAATVNGLAGVDARDVDGDGLDELLLAAGRRLALAGAPAPQ